MRKKENEGAPITASSQINHRPLFLPFSRAECEWRVKPALQIYTSMRVYIP